MPSNDPVYRFKATLQVQGAGSFVDQNAGGGQDPPVIGFAQQGNTNQIWEFYAVPGFETRVVIKNTATKYVLYANALQNKVQLGRNDVWDAASQWYLEGGPVDGIDSGSIVRLRNVKYPNGYLDLSGGDKTNGTAILVWPGHGGNNQSFKLTKV